VQEVRSKWNKLEVRFVILSEAKNLSWI
jgi:hypothetical protein